MSRPELPLKILSLLSPILSWVEGTSATALPRGWDEEVYHRTTGSVSNPSAHKSVAALQQRNWLLQQLPTYSLDNIDEVMALSKPENINPLSLADWQPSSRQLTLPPGYHLLQVFDYLAERYLLWDGGKAVIKRQHMLELHALGLRLPLAFMVQHFYARAVANGDKKLENVVKLPESMNLLPSNATSIRNVIKRGLSEGHLHLNAIHATENNWANYLLEPMEHQPKAFSINDWRLLRFSRAVAQTLALATTLARSNISVKAQDGSALHQALDKLYFANDAHALDEYEKDFKKKFDAIVEKLEPASALQSADQLFTDKALAGEFDEKQFGIFYWLDPWRRSHWRLFYDNADYPRLKSANVCRHYLGRLHLAAHLALIQTPVQPAFKQSDTTNQQRDKNATYASANFLHRSLFKYLIVQSHHWQLAVQQGRTTGLRQFKSYFDSKQRKPINANARENAIAVFKQVQKWKGLRVLEGRIAPPESAERDLLPWLEAFATSIKHSSKIKKLGLVVHFIKDQATNNKQTIGSIKQDRYGSLRVKYQKEAFHLFYILAKSALENPFIVGIDAANLELATPPEVFAPIFRFLRDAPIEVSITNNFDSHAQDNWQLHRAIKHLVKNRRLGMTYHVGEEFRHLLSGLRAIDEVLKFLNPQPGDRIGHGIALGLDPGVWLQQTGSQTLLPKQEWLDTLVWIYHYLGAIDASLSRLQIENQIERLAREIYQHGDVHTKNKDTNKNARLNPMLLWDAWLLRQLNPDSVTFDENDDILFQPLNDNSPAAWRWNRIGRSIVKAVCKKVGKNPPGRLLKQYWYDDKTRAEGDRLHLVDMEDNAAEWIEVCKKMQQLMQQRVIDRQMVVETNPSSNLSIGMISQLQEHPIFSMAFDHNKNWQRRLRMTINTDNPGTANTSLAHEYYLLGEVLIQMNYPESQVTDWLEWLRQCGEESSFVRHLPEPDDPNMKLVIDAILARCPPKPIGNSRVRLNQWFDRLGGDEGSINTLVQQLFETNDKNLKTNLLQAIIRKAIDEHGNSA